MSSTPATVKWGKETLSITLTPGQTGASLKAALLALTSVPAARQKLMSKAWKGVLRDDQAVDEVAQPPPIIITLMGSAEAGAAPPPTAAVFVEDLPAGAAARAGAAAPSGLANNENTCYANSASARERREAGGAAPPPPPPPPPYPRFFARARSPACRHARGAALRARAVLGAGGAPRRARR